MDKIIRKIIAVILYGFLMYLSYNIFIPEQSVYNKSYTFLKKQENIVKFEAMLEEARNKDASKMYHLTKGIPDVEERVLNACEKCHSIYPHKEQRNSRAFYNMHSFRISCLTCHIKKADMKKIKTGWIDDDGSIFNDGGKVKGARITPYLMSNSVETVPEKDMKDHQDLNSTYKINISKREDIMCKSCHKKKGKLLLDLASLGYDGDKIKHLRELDEAKMYDRKEGWSYPDFL